MAETRQKLGPYEVHPFADAFPFVVGEEFDDLVASIKENGLRNPIVVTYDRKTLIDGRNRYRACEFIGVTPQVRVLEENYTEEMILKFIADENIKRRHLNPSQRAVLALACIERLKEDAKKRQGARTDLRSDDNIVAGPPQGSERVRERKSREQAAKIVNASGRLVQQAEAVRRDTPELLEKVRSGELTLNAADKQRKVKMTKRKTESKKRQAEKAEEDALAARILAEGKGHVVATRVSRKVIPIQDKLHTATLDYIMLLRRAIDEAAIDEEFIQAESVKPKDYRLETQIQKLATEARSGLLKETLDKLRGK